MISIKILENAVTLPSTYTQVHMPSTYTQNVPINMGIKRWFENCLWYPYSW